MSKRVVLTFAQSFDLTDTVAETLAEEGLTPETADPSVVEELAKSQMEDHDFNKRAAGSMRVEVVDGPRTWVCHWSKTYHASGTVELQAHTEEEAVAKIRERIGDLEGSMQYDPDKDEVEAYEKKED